MNKDQRAVERHDRATRGQELSAEEQSFLAQWYAFQDQEEKALLANTSPPPSLTELKERVNASLAQLPATMRRIQWLAAANGALRLEIDDYKQKIAQTPASQTS